MVLPVVELLPALPILVLDFGSFPPLIMADVLMVVALMVVVVVGERLRVGCGNRNCADHGQPVGKFGGMEESRIADIAIIAVRIAKAIEAEAIRQV